MIQFLKKIEKKKKDILTFSLSWILTGEDFNGKLETFTWQCFFMIDEFHLKYAVQIGKMIWNIFETYRIYYMYLDRQPWANSVDPDEKPCSAATLLAALFVI